jgi:NADH-quinone oxidoreductase subunit N
VASKAAALGLLARLAIAFAGVEAARVLTSGLVVLLAAVTCTFGNLAAYGQTNIKRLLAYSTIAHAGYMMMPMAAAVVLAATNKLEASAAVAAMLFYAAIYLFMNLGAFAAAAFLRNASGSERIDDYAGLVRRSPGVAVCFSVVLFSLIGLPPLAGFAGKFAVFAALYQAGLLGLLAIGVLNTVLSLFYYLRVVRVMIFVPEAADRPAPAVPLWSAPGLFCLAAAIALGLLFLWWAPFEWANAATAGLFR